MIKTKCKGVGCMRREKCLRFTQETNTHKWMRPPIFENVYNHELSGQNDNDCEFFINNAAFRPAQMKFTIED